MFPLFADFHWFPLSHYHAAGHLKAGAVVFIFVSSASNSTSSLFLIGEWRNKCWGTSFQAIPLFTDGKLRPRKATWCDKIILRRGEKPGLPGFRHRFCPHNKTQLVITDLPLVTFKTSLHTSTLWASTQLSLRWGYSFSSPPPDPAPVFPQGKANILFPLSVVACSYRISLHPSPHTPHRTPIPAGWQFVSGNLAPSVQPDRGWV